MAKGKPTSAEKFIKAKETLRKAHTRIQINHANDYGNPDDILKRSMDEKHEKIKEIYRQARKGK